MEASIVDLTTELIKELQNLPNLNGLSIESGNDKIDESSFAVLAAVKMLVS